MNRKEAIVQICKEYQETKQIPKNIYVSVKPVIGWAILYSTQGGVAIQSRSSLDFPNIYPIILSSRTDFSEYNIEAYAYFGYYAFENDLKLQVKEVVPKDTDDQRVYVIPEHREAYSVVVEFNNGLQMWLGVHYGEEAIAVQKAVEKLKNMLNSICSKILSEGASK